MLRVVLADRDDARHSPRVVLNAATKSCHARRDSCILRDATEKVVCENQLEDRQAIQSARLCVRETVQPRSAPCVVQITRKIERDPRVSHRRSFEREPTRR
jgi:hypothetical protein